jgi:hypothetical protein
MTTVEQGLWAGTHKPVKYCMPWQDLPSPCTGGHLTKNSFPSSEMYPRRSERDQRLVHDGTVFSNLFNRLVFFIVVRHRTGGTVPGGRWWRDVGTGRLYGTAELDECKAARAAGGLHRSPSRNAGSGCGGPWRRYVIPPTNSLPPFSDPAASYFDVAGNQARRQAFFLSFHFAI